MNLPVAAIVEEPTVTFWLAVGFLGQAMFCSRFFVQWIATERAQKSVVPVLFWYLSIGGSLLLLSYAIYRKDPVFIAGQAPNSLIYMRNLFFIKKEQRAKNAKIRKTAIKQC